MRLRGGVLEPVQRVPAFKYTTDPARRAWTTMIYPYAPYFFNLLREIPWGSFYFNNNDFTAKCNSRVPYIIKGGAAFEIIDRGLADKAWPSLHDYVDPTGDIDINIPPLVVKPKPELTNKEYFIKLSAATKTLPKNTERVDVIDIAIDIAQVALKEYSYYSVMRGLFNALVIIHKNPKEANKNKATREAENESLYVLHDTFPGFNKDEMDEYVRYGKNNRIFSYFTDAKGTFSPVGEKFTGWLITNIIQYFQKLSRNFPSWFPDAVPFKKLGPQYESNLATYINTVGPFGIYRYVQGVEEENENFQQAARCKVQVAMNYKYMGEGGKEEIGQAVFIEFIIEGEDLVMQESDEPHLFVPKFGLYIRDINTEIEMNTSALEGRFHLLGLNVERGWRVYPYKFINHVKRAEYMINAVRHMRDVDTQLIFKYYRAAMNFLAYMAEDENKDAVDAALFYLKGMLVALPKAFKNTNNSVAKSNMASLYSIAGIEGGGMRRKLRLKTVKNRK